MTRRFHLLRMTDPTGVSGEGIVADGVWHEQAHRIELPSRVLNMPPGWCELTWRGALTSTSLWRSADMLMAVHGHDGATVLVWKDMSD